MTKSSTLQHEEIIISFLTVSILLDNIYIIFTYLSLFSIINNAVAALFFYDNWRVSDKVLHFYFNIYFISHRICIWMLIHFGFYTPVFIYVLACQNQLLAYLNVSHIFTDLLCFICLYKYYFWALTLELNSFCWKNTK